MQRTRPIGARSLLDSRSMVSAWCRSIQIERNQKSLVCKKKNSVSFVRVSSFASILATVPRLRGAVELLLTGDQHRPCASFNQQACKNTTSVAKGKRESPQKIASKCAKITKKRPHFGVHKLTRFGVRLRVRILLKIIPRKTTPKTGASFGPQNGSICGPQNGAFSFKNLRILMQFFVAFSACLLLRMLYSYMRVD